MVRGRIACSPHPSSVAIIANDAIGNYAIASGLAAMMREEWKPRRLELWSGDRIADFAADPRPFDRVRMFLRKPKAVVEELVREAAPDHDLVVNIEDSPEAKVLPRLLCSRRTVVCGPALLADGSELPWTDDEFGRLWAERGWTSADLRSRYPFLRSQFIGEVFARLVGLLGDLRPPVVTRAAASIAVPDVLIAMSASLPEKLWPLECWREVLSTLSGRHGIEVGLLGARPAAQRGHWLGADAEDAIVGEGLARDLRGTMTLPQVADAIDRARAVLTLDNGIMHLAATSPAPVVALFRHGIHRLWTPSWGRIDAVVAPEGRPVSSIPVDAVTAACDRVGLTASAT
jgi:heptosyltransferase-3